MNDVEAVIRAVGAERVPDPRMGVFDVRVEPAEDGALALRGESTDAGAVEAVVERVAASGIRLVDEVVRLPDPALGDDVAATVRSAIAPVHAEPRVSSTQVSQYVLGHRLDLLSRRDLWYRVRGEDGYIGWVHHGYLNVCRPEEAQGWERGVGGEPVVSLGAEIVDAEGNLLTRAPWGARLIRVAPRVFRLPDGRLGHVGHGEVVDVDRLLDWFPLRGESIARTARRWLGAPYLWGGVTPAGADCSGFVQSVFWIHGVALPRDADLQSRVGSPFTPDPDLEDLRPGDLLFFSEHGDRVTHVALSLGGGMIIHSALSNGGVAIDDLNGARDVERRLRPLLVAARRLVPD